MLSDRSAFARSRLRRNLSHSNMLSDRHLSHGNMLPDMELWAGFRSGQRPSERSVGRVPLRAESIGADPAMLPTVLEQLIE